MPSQSVQQVSSQSTTIASMVSVSGQCYAGSQPHGPVLHSVEPVRYNWTKSTTGDVHCLQPQARQFRVNAMHVAARV